VKTILTPIDFSSVSDAVIDAAHVLARACGGRIVIMSVAQPPVITSDYGPMLENIGEIIAESEKRSPANSNTWPPKSKCPTCRFKPCNAPERPRR